VAAARNPPLLTGNLPVGILWILVLSINDPEERIFTEYVGMIPLASNGDHTNGTLAELIGYE
jgi:hypothetical protein